MVQLYVSWPEATIPSLPKLQLVAFKRIEILPSRSETVNFAVPGLQLMVWVDTNTGFKVLPGKYCMAFLIFRYTIAQKATLQQHHFCHAFDGKISGSKPKRKLSISLVHPCEYFFRLWNLSILHRFTRVLFCL